jgi:glycosyltransferase involved in cell wall biosynthesis
LGLIWEGSFFVHHSLANINCQVAMLLARRDIDLGLVPFEPHQFNERVHRSYRLIANRLYHEPARVHCHVRHRWPPWFARPKNGAFVLIQPWEFGWLPRAWIDPIARSVDEVWAHTRYVRDIYLRSGVDPRKVKLVPLGVDPALFNPHRAPARIGTSKSFKFLFVGGATLRKGFDILLRAYTEEFTSDDDVCLVIKDFFYGGEAAVDVRAARRRRGAPEILYRYDNIDFHDLGGLFTACDCYVHPYRSEGFGLPIIEAMACGLPVIVTGWGAARDFCNDTIAYLIPAEETRVPAALWGRALPTVGPPMWSEPDLSALRRTMRRVFDHRVDARRKGMRASAHIRSRFTWTRVVDEMTQRLERWHD